MSMPLGRGLMSSGICLIGVVSAEGAGISEMHKQFS